MIGATVLGRRHGKSSSEPRYLRTVKGASMNAEWYYVENDITIGPTTLAEVVERFRRTEGEPCFVWTEGMSDWADATRVPAISKLLESMSARPLSARQVTHSDSAIAQKETLGQRARHELVEYLAISAYLFACFGSLLFYKSAILRNEGIEFAAFGLALVKALILGKFILVLQAVKIGERGDKPSILLVDVIKMSFLFLIFLVALNAIEEIALGLFHGRAARDVLGEMAGGTLPEAIAVCVLLLLVLIPYFSFRGLAFRLGDGVLWKHFTERGSAQRE
jgi:GYF domain 2